MGLKAVWIHFEPMAPIVDRYRVRMVELNRHLLGYDPSILEVLHWNDFKMLRLIEEEHEVPLWRMLVPKVKAASDDTYNQITTVLAGQKCLGDALIVAYGKLSSGSMGYLNAPDEQYELMRAQCLSIYNRFYGYDLPF